MPKKILVCGSRNWLKKGIIHRVMCQVLEGGDIVIHGACRGADEIAGSVAKSYGHEVREYPADWKKHGKAAGPIRNQGMLDLEKPDLVLAFMLPDSRGTADMVRRAKAAGIKTIVVDG